MIYDIHSHLNDKKFDRDLKEVIDKMESDNVFTNVVGYDLNSSKKALHIATISSNLKAIVGIHPDDAESFDLETFKPLVNYPDVVGIGECGFDFYWHDKDQKLILQEKVFRHQIELAIEHGLPLMLHVRSTKDTADAYEEALRVLDSYKDLPPVNFHFYTGPLDILKEILSRDHTVSFTCVITTDDTLAPLVEATPLTHMYAETDSPYSPPATHRGQRTEPWMAGLVIDKIASIKNLPPESVRQTLFDNANKTYTKYPTS